MNEITLTFLEKLSSYLNYHSDWIKCDMIQEMTADGVLSEEEACRFLLAAALNIDPYGSSEDRALFRMLSKSLCCMDPVRYLSDSYRKLPFHEFHNGGWSFKYGYYAPYEIFVRDDFKRIDDVLLPQLGYFSVEYQYPQLLQNGREWMSITPNEVHTMERALCQTHGKVLTYGLGMGYYLFHALERSDVSSVTVVEKDEKILSLFQSTLLPYFPRKNCVQLIHSDAFLYAEKEMGHEDYDVIFTDLWHDAGDGIPMYQKMKKLESRSPGSIFLYWIEDTIKAYLD